MPHSSEPLKNLMGGIWLIGLGVLFYTGRWWPGILFLVGITMLIEGWIREHFWAGVQAGFWIIFVAVWALFRFSIPFLFVGVGASMILATLVKPNPLEKPKPFVDSSLE
jgi:hypothetical protein